MALLSRRDRNAAEQFATLAFTNPFLPERMELERRILGNQFAGRSAVWSYLADGIDDSPNFRALMERSGTLVRPSVSARRPSMASARRIAAPRVAPL